MEIGLTAKVSPEVNEREAEKQASLLEGHMEQAVQDLEAGVEMDDVVARVSDMNDHVEGLSEHTTTASENFSEMEESLDNFDTGVLEELGGGDFGMDVLFGDGPAMMGGGEEQQEPSMMQSAVGGITDMASGGLDQMNEQLGALGSSLRDQSVFMSRRLAQASSIRGILGSLGRTFSKTGGKVALAGIGLILLSRIASKMVEQSPLLGTVTDILGQALGLFFRPFGNIIGRLLLPIATNMIQLAANFNRVFGERGIIAALLFLGEYIVRGLGSAGETAGRKLVLGNDGEFGIADAVRIAFMAAIGKKLLARIFTASLPTITSKGVLNFVFPGLGSVANRIAKRFGIEVLEQAVTTSLKNGLTRIFGRITPAFIKQPIKRLFTSVRGFSLVGAITSRLPSISARGLLSGLMARIPSIGVKSILAKLIPSAGKGLLASIGLKGLLAGLGGRLAYAIPVVGQIIGLLDLLVMAITFLIPGMETFSPIMYTLTKLFELGVFLFTGLLDALRGLWDWLTGISLGSLIPDISLGGLMEGGFSGLVEKIDDIVSSLMFYIGPILETFKLPLALLAPFALLGISLYETLTDVSWSDIEDFLDEIKQSVGEFASAAGTFIEDTTREIWDFVEDTEKEVWEFVDDAEETIWNFVADTEQDIWNFVKDAKSTSQDIWNYVTDNSRDVWYWVNENSRDVWYWINENSKDLWGFINEESRDLWSYINEESRDLWNYINEQTKDLWQFIREETKDLWQYINETTKDVWDFINQTTRDVWNFILQTSRDLWGFINTEVRNLWSYINTYSRDLWDFINTSTKNVWDFITTSTRDLFDYVSTPSFGAYDIGDYISTPSFGEFEIDRYIDEPSFGEFEIDDYLDVPGYNDINISESAFDIPNIDVDVPDITLDEYDFNFDIDLDEYDFDFDIELDEYDFEIPEIKFEDAGDSLIPDFEFGSGGVVKSATTALVGEAGPEVILPFDKVPGFTANILQGDAIGDAIPGLATGGVVTEPTTAVVGEGTESEAVLPLSRLESLIQTPSEPDIGNTTAIEVNVEGGDSQAFTGNDEDSIASAIASALSSEFQDLKVSMDEVRTEIRRLRRNQRATIEADGKVIAEISEENKDRYKRSRNITK